MPTNAIRSLHARVMKEVIVGGAISMHSTFPGGIVYSHIDLEKLRIVMLKAMAIAYRIGHAAGKDTTHAPDVRLH